MVPRKIIYDLVAGDDGPPLPVRFEGLDLADFSSVKIYVERDDGTRFSRDVTPDLSDEELGFVDWHEGDLTEGQHKAEFKLISVADGYTLTLPRRYSMTLSVRVELG
jgi:hypothetical protein